MSGTGKKKVKVKSGGNDPPQIPEINIFDWFADAKLGFWSPLEKVLPNALNGLLDSSVARLAEVGTVVPGELYKVISEIYWEKYMEIAERTARQLWDRIKLPGQPTGEDELARSAAEKWKLAVLSNIINMAILGGTVAAVSTPFGFLWSEVLDEIWRMPVLQASLQFATDVLLGEYNYSGRIELQRYWLRKHTPVVPEAYRLALAAAKGIISLETYLKAMAENGLNEEWANMWMEENRNYPSFTQLTDMYWRGLIDEETFEAWMQRNGYSKEVIEAFKGLREYIPPISDLIRFAVREAFPVEPGRPQFEEMKKWARKQGLSDWWVERYWLAHFDRMSLTQAYENYWRGYFTEDDFKRYLMLADIHPDDWDAILRVAYRPPTLRELGYGYDVGVYKKEDIEKYRRWEGLSPEDAKLAAEALVAYRTEAEREALRREYMYLFAYGRISEEEFRKKLKELITAKEAIDLWVERAKVYRERIMRYPRPEESVAITASEAKWAFVHGLRDEDWLREQLKTLGWTSERIDIYVEQAKQERAELLAEEKEKPYRRLTISQLADMYRYGFLTADRLVEELQNLGYSREHAEVLAKIIVEEEKPEAKVRELSRTDHERLYDFRINVLSDEEAVERVRFIARREGEPSPTWKLYEAYRQLGYSEGDAARLTIWTGLNLRYPDLRAMYRNGWISARQMYEELLALGLPEERADELMRMTVKVEQPARLRKERDLTKSEILKGAKAGLLTPEQAMRLLMDLGYDRDEAMYLLVLNKVVAAGDPEGYWDMRRVVEAYKKARGEKALEIPDELVRLEKRIRELKAKMEELIKSKAPEAEISRVASELAGLEVKYRSLLIKLGLSEEARR